ncbi:MAG: septum formation family protein [Candidatus Limnocylindrales bacterium]
MREINRYRRASLLEQLGDVVRWFRSHPVAAIALLLLAAGYVAGVISPPKPSGPTDLAVGDCIFARTAAVNDTQPGARPIGAPADVASIVMAGAAERAPCAGSHGHEVLAVVGMFATTGEYVDQRALIQANCDAAFKGYVGVPESASIFEAFAAAPSRDEWNTGLRTGLCLVARKDGQWMSEPARGSSE